MHFSPGNNNGWKRKRRLQLSLDNLLVHNSSCYWNVVGCNLRWISYSTASVFRLFRGLRCKIFFFFIKPNLTYLSNTTFDFTLLQSIMEMLMKGILFPRFCSENMIYGRAGFWKHLLKFKVEWNELQTLFRFCFSS